MSSVCHGNVVFHIPKYRYDVVTPSTSSHNTVKLQAGEAQLGRTQTARGNVWG